MMSININAYKYIFSVNLFFLSALNYQLSCQCSFFLSKCEPVETPSDPVNFHFGVGWKKSLFLLLLQ